MQVRKERGPGTVRMTEEVDRKAIGKRIQAVFCSTGTSIGLFSSVLRCNRTTPYKWFKGEAMPPVEKLIRIKEEYGVSIDWILTGEGEQWIP